MVLGLYDTYEYGTESLSQLDADELLGTLWIAKLVGRMKQNRNGMIEDLPKYPTIPYSKANKIPTVPLLPMVLFVWYRTVDA